ncbi:52 kDa repressor of the inhibitor of the protein kinase-like, partial [Aphis craccivora]
MAKWLEETDKRQHRVTYLGVHSQNEFINLLGTKTRDMLIKEIKNAEFYSVIADTTPDLTHHRLTINIRYISDKNGVLVPNERLLKMDVVLTKKTVVELAEKNFGVLNSLGLPVDQIVFQSYDFASNMSGNTSRHQRLEEDLKNVENSLQLKNLSKTRWTARAESIKAVSVSYENVVHVLEDMKSSRDFDSNTKLKNITEFLEAEKLNIIDAMQLIESTVKSFQEINDEKKIDALVKSAASFAKNCNVDPEKDFNKHHRHRLKPKKIDENPETAAVIEFSQFYRKEFKILLDIFTSTVNKHLQSMVILLRPFQETFRIPADRKNCTIYMIEAMIKVCPEILLDEPECLHSEIQILLDASKECKNVDDIFKKACMLRNVIPRAFRIVKLVLTSPVSSASSERSFSRLKLVYNHLRTTMSDERLDSLLVLFSARDIVDKINIQEIVNKWSLLKHRRVK